MVWTREPHRCVVWGLGQWKILHKEHGFGLPSFGLSDVLTVDFNPWQLVNRPTLSEAFFDELGVALGKGDLGSNRLRKSVLARYRRWAHRLQGGRD